MSFRAAFGVVPGLGRRAPGYDHSPSAKLLFGSTEPAVRLQMEIHQMSRPQRATAKPAPRGGPTVMRILVGAQLRRLRRASGTTPGQAARAIRASNAKISRMELGRVGFKERD